MMSVTPRLQNDHMGDYNEGENEEGVTKADLLYHMKLSYFSYS